MSPRPHRLSPAELSPSFPDAPSPDPVAEIARLFVLNLRAVIGDRSGRDVARLTGVDRTTLGAILVGTTWPDMVTVIRLELALGSL